jgi:hypothetical protein
MANCIEGCHAFYSFLPALSFTVTSIFAFESNQSVINMQQSRTLTYHSSIVELEIGTFGRIMSCIAYLVSTDRGEQ